MSKPVNAADENQVKAATQKQKLKDDNNDIDLKVVLGTEQGRRVLWNQLVRCGVYKSSFTGSSETFFLEGRRDIGLKLLADIMRVAPERYLEMHNQSKGDN